MSKKIDIKKLISSGSAKQRAVILFYHLNLKEAIEKKIPIGEHKLPLTEAEAKELYNSFTSDKDIKVYNRYRELSMQIIQAMRWLTTLLGRFQSTYWKYQATYLERYYRKVKLKETSNISALEDALINDYSGFLEYYTALKIYIKESRYMDKFIISNIDQMYDILHTEEWSYYIRNGEADFTVNLSEIEPDEDVIKDVLKIEFNLEYETEEE